MNIVTTILNMIAPAILDKLAASLGISSGAAKSALAAAIPAVLGAMGSKASSDVGARALFDAVSKTNTNATGDLASTLTGGAGANFMKDGLGSLTAPVTRDGVAVREVSSTGGAAGNSVAL